MPKFLHSDALDPNLNYIKANAIRLALVSGYVFGDSYATVMAKKIAEVVMASGDYTLGTSGNDRTLTTAAGKTATATADSQQYDNGTASAGGATTLTDASKAFGVNAHANRMLIITAGTGSGQRRKVTSNTATVITVPAWATNPDNTSVYKIVDDLHWVAHDNAAKVLWATDETTDQIVTMGNTIAVPQLVLTSGQPV